jgi:signal transduction histidine kinase
MVLGVDITEKKHSEQALLQNEKLAAVGRLASTIAHEINNPLEAVTNLVYLTRRTSDPQQADQFLDLAELELRRMSSITRQTLSFNKQIAVPHEVNCEDLFGSVIGIYQSRFVNAGVTVERRLRAHHPLFCIGGEIRQVLNNLVSNAVDAMPHGGRLLLRSRDATHPLTGESGIVLTVADNGTGIRADRLRRIFEPFYSTKDIGGTGLGLWISHDIIERHLRVRSSVGPSRRGTVFTFFLPRTGPQQTASSS